ncbi:MAG: hypothetical protein ABH803_04065 [Candidatus Micrarchaeota archaeon]
MAKGRRGSGSRGREKTVKCAGCGRSVARSKAVYIEKPVLQNPLEAKDVYSEHYDRVLTREFAYCISCGKHRRIFEKKKQMAKAQRERSFLAPRRPYSPVRPGINRESTAKQDSTTPAGEVKDLEKASVDSLESFTEDEADSEPAEDYLEELTEKKKDKLTEDSVGAVTEEEVEDDDSKE